VASRPNTLSQNWEERKAFKLTLLKGVLRARREDSPLEKCNRSWSARTAGTRKRTRNMCEGKIDERKGEARLSRKAHHSKSGGSVAKGKGELNSLKKGGAKEGYQGGEVYLAVGANALH